MGGCTITANGSLSEQKAKVTKKRRRDDDLNELLPTGPDGVGKAGGNFEFNEVLDEEVNSRYFLQLFS